MFMGTSNNFGVIGKKKEKYIDLSGKHRLSKSSRIIYNPF